MPVCESCPFVCSTYAELVAHQSEAHYKTGSASGGLELTLRSVTPPRAQSSPSAVSPSRAAQSSLYNPQTSLLRGASAQSLTSAANQMSMYNQGVPGFLPPIGYPGTVSMYGGMPLQAGMSPYMPQPSLTPALPPLNAFGGMPDPSGLAASASMYNPYLQQSNPYNYTRMQYELESARRQLAEVNRLAADSYMSAKEEEAAQEKAQVREMQQMLADMKMEMVRQQREAVAKQMRGGDDGGDHGYISRKDSSSKKRGKKGNKRGSASGRSDYDDAPQDDERVPFPTRSRFSIGYQYLSLDRVSGIDVQVPLQDVRMEVKQFFLFDNRGEWVLEPVGSQEFRNCKLTRKSALSFDIKGANMEFRINQNWQLHCMVTSFWYRQTVLFWTVVWARRPGDWISLLRKPPIDVASAIQLPGVGCLADSTLQGTIEGSGMDPVQEAELYLKRLKKEAGSGGQTSSSKKGKKNKKGVSKRDGKGGRSSDDDVRATPGAKPSTVANSANANGGGDRKPSATGASPPPRRRSARDSPSESSSDDSYDDSDDSDDSDDDEEDGGKTPVPDPRPDNSKTGKIEVPPTFVRDHGKDPASVARFCTPSPTTCVTAFGLKDPTGASAVETVPIGGGAKGSECKLTIDCVSTLPMTAVCTRLLIFLSESVDPQTGAIVTPALNDPKFFARPPSFMIAQKPTTSNLDPQFGDAVTCHVGDNTSAVVIVEYITESVDTTFTFGHCYLPISKKLLAGKYVGRVKSGDPRRSQMRAGVDERPPDKIYADQLAATASHNQRDLEASICAQELQYDMTNYPQEYWHYCAASFCMWRADSKTASRAYQELPGTLPLSTQELALLVSRKKMKPTPPATANDLQSTNDILNCFMGLARPMTDQISYVSLYEKQRGVFINVEELRGLSNNLHFVLVEARDAEGETMKACYTVDASSDMTALSFTDNPLIFTGAEYNDLSIFIFRVFRVDMNPAEAKAANGSLANVKINFTLVAWTVSRMFLNETSVARTGRYQLLLFKGNPPDAFLDELDVETMDRVYLAWLQGATPAKQLNVMQPFAVLTIGQGEPARIPEIVCNHSARMTPRPLLITPNMRPQVPLTLTDGRSGVTVAQAFGLGNNALPFMQQVGQRFEEYIRKTVSMPNNQGQR